MLNFIKKEPLLNIKLKEILSPADIYTLMMLGLYTILAIVFYMQIKNPSNLILYNVLIAGAVLSVATVAAKMDAGRLFKLFRKVYIVPVIFFIYSQAQDYINIINPHLYDSLLIKWDFSIFGVNPTQWLARFSNPYLTEYLQFAYMSFFFMPVIHGVELHYTGREEEFDRLVSIIAFSFYLSYLMYFFLPAIGPRFMLHDFANLSNELPGVWFTDTFRHLVNSGGGITANSVNPAAIVNRDCMPSGHTWITLVNIYMAYKFRSHTRWVYYIIGSSLIFATVYLRYHYVVDIMAGVIFAVLCIIIEPKIRAFLKTKGFTRA